jgi:tRNA(Leu) C34 or U34 (ribose-2'-O)-methylase TrmL
MTEIKGECFRDMDGTVVINEIEARSDIGNIRRAKAKLEEAMKLIDPAKLDDARMSGKAKDALEDQRRRIYKNLANLSSSCENSGQLIERAVAKYRRIDRELAKIVKEG